ncbi:MAG: PCMD domain-containing protein [Bacteroidales bacterium]|nr:PCMD domain-containing protein [Bacteroidales bacterium]
MRKILTYIVPLFSVLLICSCIENDLSYPALEPELLSIEFEGQKSVAIDKDSCVVSVVMGENADLSKVKVLSYVTAHDAEVVDGMPEYLDLRDTVNITLRIYKDVVWRIAATQPIERYIRCDNQTGEPDIDPIRKQAIVYVTENQPLESVVITDMKLEPEGSVIVSTIGFLSESGQSIPKTEDCSFPMTLDCVIMRYFNVEYEGQMIEWSVKFLQKKVAVSIAGVDPWTCSAFVRGTTDGQGTPLIEYRKDSDSDWTVWEDLTVTGTSVFAEITGLEENTTYMARVTNGVETSAEIAFTTGIAETLSNLSFDDWHMNGSAWMPSASGAAEVWDSANPGTAGLGIVPTRPEEADVVKGKAARLETMTALGMLAAGNIYVGHFGKIAGLGAELDWGYPFSSRPLALRGYYKYAPKSIDMAKDPYKGLMGQSDECQIQILLTDWPDRFHINTSKKIFVDFANDKHIIAHGSLTSSDTDPEYVRFSIPLVYRNDRTPKYIVIVGAASRYGDYFTGGKGSVLKLDEFELIYDPTQLTEDEHRQFFENLL